MPRATPVKNMKNIKTKSIKEYFSPMKETDSSCKNRKVLQNLDNAQNTEGQSHQFQFRYKKVSYAVACDTSKTVLDALNKNKIFRKIQKDNIQKEIILQRSRGEVPRAAVKTDFPCCRILKDEIIDVNFIKKDDTASTPPKPSKRPSFPNKPENFVTFYIKTKGKGKVKQLMMNKELWKNDVDCVCVHAFIEDTLKTALKRDGRFKKIIFKKRCELSEFGSETIHDMTHPVKHLDGKHFLMIISNDNNQSDSQDDAKENADPNQHPINTQQDQKQKETPVKCTNPDRPVPKIIPGSKEILKVLLKEIKCFLEELRSGDSSFRMQTFMRTEYDKSVVSFSEVKKVKEIMRLSSSVCQIRVQGSPYGTGFLLFNRFVLTNAHVIKDFDPFTRKLSESFTAVFGFEDLEQKEIRCIPVKEHVAAYFHGDDDMKRHLDFALLELDESLDCPELLSHYSSAGLPNGGGICIVGHPDGGVKRMDPCFIISREHQLEAVKKHASQNVNYYHVITQQSLEMKTHKNQITYDSCFFYGSSGSPVFDEGCRLIGVHTGGYVYRGDRGKTRSIMEYGFSIQPILENIIKQAKNNGRFDISNLLTEFKSLHINLNMEDNDVEMTEEPQNQEEYEEHH